MSLGMLALSFTLFAGDLRAQEEDAEAAGAAEAAAVEEKAASTDLTQEDRIRAVSRKTFLKRGRFDVTPFGGTSANDAFFRHWHVGGRASYHLVDSLSLELGGAWVPFTETLEPVSFLRRTQNAVSDDATIFGFGELGVTFSPVYGKLAVMKEWIIHFDAFVSGGVAGIVTSNEGFIENLPAVHPAMEVGVGARVFLLKWLVVRGEVRDYIYPQDRSNISTVQNLLMFNLGVSFFFPFDFKYENQAFKIVG
jgi:outer membrane beta-barrel protein